MEDKKKKKTQENEEINLIRILGKDIKENKKLLSGLTQIKGISWSFANALCRVLNLDKNKKIRELSKEELQKIGEFFKVEGIPHYLKNRQRDFDDGRDKHIIGADLNLRNEFDIKRLKKIKSYRGVRHSAGLPVRGQRSKSHFRKNRKKSGAVGVKTKK